MEEKGSMPEKDIIKVMIVEDDPVVREGIKSMINTTEGFSCMGDFSSGEAALDGISGLRPDVVLMDINLPGIDGISCMIQMKASNPGIQFIMLTIFEDSDLIFNSLAAGASGYLLKHTRPAKLLEAIADVYQGGSPMTSEIARKVVESFQHSVKNPNIAYGLTKREEEILAYLAKGFFYKEIADQLSISTETVRTHLRNIYEKLQVRTRTEAILKYLNK